MRTLIAATVVLGLVVAAGPAAAVLQSTSVVVTDQGRAIPGATISLSRPHPRSVHTAANVRSTSYAQSASQPYQPPRQQNWVVARSDQTGRVALRFDDRDAPPDAVVDVTLYYPDGTVRQRDEVPVALLLAGGVLEMAANDMPQPAYAVPGGYGPSFDPPMAPVEAIAVPLPSVGFGLGFGMHGHGGFHSRDR